MAKNDVQALRRILAAQLRHYRRAKGWTQSQLAERSSLSLDMIGRLERGSASPSLDTIARLSKVLGLQAAILLGGLSQLDRKRDEKSDRLDSIFKMLVVQPAHELDRVEAVVLAMLRK